MRSSPAKASHARPLSYYFLHRTLLYAARRSNDHNVAFRCRSFPVLLLSLSLRSFRLSVETVTIIHSLTQTPPGPTCRHILPPELCSIAPRHLIVDGEHYAYCNNCPISNLQTSFLFATHWRLLCLSGWPCTCGLASSLLSHRCGCWAPSCRPSKPYQRNQHSIIHSRTVNCTSPHGRSTTSSEDFCTHPLTSSLGHLTITRSTERALRLSSWLVTFSTPRRQTTLTGAPSLSRPLWTTSSAADTLSSLFLSVYTCFPVVISASASYASLTLGPRPPTESHTQCTTTRSTYLSLASVGGLMGRLIALSLSTFSPQPHFKPPYVQTEWYHVSVR